MQMVPYVDSAAVLSKVSLPDLVLLRQRFPRPRVADRDVAIRAALEVSSALTALQPGARVAVAVGSRGVADIALIVTALVAQLRQRQLDPFIVPAMGSHGGATDDGQREVLRSLGVTPEQVGAPIVSSLDVDALGTLPNGLPVYIDRAAHGADGIVVVNRIKPHTDFGAAIESGLAKMIAIGLGKHAGALAVHSWGIAGLAEHIPAVAQHVVARAPFVLGLAVIENAYDEVAEIVGVPPEGFGGEIERELLVRAKSLMARLPWDTLDVLVVDTLGKDLSGSGMDTNIIGRMRMVDEPKPTATSITNIVALDITDGSHGNAIGVGLADFMPLRLAQRIDFQAMYTNAITAGVISGNSCKLPMLLATDRDAIAAALHMCGQPDLRTVRFARTPSTLNLEYLLASPSAVATLRAGSDVEVVGAPLPFALQPDGAVLPFAVACANYGLSAEHRSRV